MKNEKTLDRAAGSRVSKAIFSFALALAIFLFCQANTLETKSFLVDIEAKNASTFIPARWESPKASVVVRGKRGALNNLTAGDFRAFVDLSLCESEGSVSLPVEISVSESAMSINPLEISAKKASLQFQIEEKIESELPVYVSVEGEPAEGFELASFGASPEKVKVFGTKSAIASCGGKIPVPLDISNRNGDFSVFFDISRRALPEGAVSFGSPQTVEVSAKIAPKTVKKTFSNVPVSFVNLNDDLLARQVVPLNVEIEGIFPLVSSFEFPPLAVLADCAEVVSAGEREVPLKIRLPAGLSATREARSLLTSFSAVQKDEGQKEQD